LIRWGTKTDTLGIEKRKEEGSSIVTKERKEERGRGGKPSRQIRIPMTEELKRPQHRQFQGERKGNRRLSTVGKKREKGEHKQPSFDTRRGKRPVHIF